MRTKSPWRFGIAWICSNLFYQRITSLAGISFIIVVVIFSHRSYFHLGAPRSDKETKIWQNFGKEIGHSCRSIMQSKRKCWLGEIWRISYLLQKSQVWCTSRIYIFTVIKLKKMWIWVSFTQINNRDENRADECWQENNLPIQAHFSTIISKPEIPYWLCFWLE